MRVVHATADVKSGGQPVCLAIGVFDGVHLGHRQVILQAVADAAGHHGVSAVITFDRHPAAVLAPAHVPQKIYSMPQKSRAISALGVDCVCVIHFDKAFSEISGEAFVRGLARDCGQLRSLSVGSTFVFGRRRSGNVALLEAIGKELQFSVHAVPEVLLDGQPVSSTRVREAVSAGQLDLAGRMLGRPYTLCGTIIKGKGLGGQIGVPTANLDVAGLLVPPPGVYAALATTRGQSYAAAVNVGYRPTLGEAAPRMSVEAHLLEFQGDLYGEELELAFTQKLRDEKKFPGLAALRDQIRQDITRTRELVGKSHIL